MAPAAKDDRDAPRRRIAALTGTAGWLVLSDLTLPDRPEVMPAAGQFVAELAMPLAGQAVLLDHRMPDGGVFSIFADPEAGLALLQRQDARLVRHALPGPLPTGGGLARLVYRWSLPEGRWTLSLTLLPGGETIGTGGRNPMVPRLADICALAGGAGARHRALLWFGVAESGDLPEAAPWIGVATPIETARGPVPAGQLRPGECLRTADNGLVPLLGIERLVVPGRGSMAPVLLRGSYFGAAEDIVLSAEQPVWHQGGEAEYLFGEEEVLIPARHLVDGLSALWDDRRSLVSGVILDLGLPELLLSGNCRLPSRIGPAQAAPRRLLHGYEAVPLVMAHGGRRSIAFPA